MSTNSKYTGKARDVAVKKVFNSPLVVEQGYLIKEREGIALVIIDLSERCNITGSYHDDDSVAVAVDFELDGKTCEEAIELPDYIGWDIFSAEISKRTLYICLVDELKENDTTCQPNYREGLDMKVGFISLLTIVFIILKLTNHIDWSWWWVLSPLMAAWVTVLTLFIIALICEIGFVGKNRK